MNVSQLKSAGLVNGDGTTKTAVTYDTNPDGSTDYSNVTLAVERAVPRSTMWRPAARARMR
ncbi:hypothetical protein P5W98_16880 [Paraburkholderia sp. A1BS-2L]